MLIQYYMVYVVRYSVKNIMVNFSWIFFYCDLFVYSSLTKTVHLEISCLMKLVQLYIIL